MRSPGAATPSPVLVTGGTGRLGRRVVPRLRDAGCEVRVLTRHSRQATDGIQFLTGDLRAGEGVDAAVAGVAAIVLPSQAPGGAGRGRLRPALDDPAGHPVLRLCPRRAAEDGQAAGVPAPAGFLVQPIDPDEVAARLVELTLGGNLRRQDGSLRSPVRCPRVASW